MALLLIFEYFILEVAVIGFLLFMAAWRRTMPWFIIGLIWSAFVAVDIAYSDFTITFLTSTGGFVPFNGGFTLELLPILFIGINLIGAVDIARN